MNKINKFANLYDKDGNLLRHVNEDGVLEDYTIEELEELVDALAEDADENGRIKDIRAYNNAQSILFKMYMKYGNPHKEELLEKVSNYLKSVSETEKENALNEAVEELENKVEPIKMDEYIDYEEVKENNEENTDDRESQLVDLHEAEQVVDEAA